MNCKSCHNPMLQAHGQAHHHCPACNTFQFKSGFRDSQLPILPQGKQTDFQCPKCNLRLEVGLIYENIQVCFCGNCRGFVIPSQSLGFLINALRCEYTGPDDQPVPINPSELDVPAHCPTCWETMDSHPYYGPGNIVLDTCSQCQLAWLDHGELEKIVRAPGLRPNQGPTGNHESQALRDQFQNQVESRRFNLFG